jgi:hypothetical protein
MVLLTFPGLTTIAEAGDMWTIHSGRLEFEGCLNCHHSLVSGPTFSSVIILTWKEYFEYYVTVELIDSISGCWHFYYYEKQEEEEERERRLENRKSGVAEGRGLGIQKICEMENCVGPNDHSSSWSTEFSVVSHTVPNLNDITLVWFCCGYC